MNILVLTTRNIYDSTGEKTLMLSKDRFLKKENIDLFYYSFRRKFKSFLSQDFNIIKQQSMFDLVYKKNEIKKNLESVIKKYDIELIVISGNWILFLYKELKQLKKQFNVKLSYDYQGAIEEVKEYKLFKNNQFLSNVLFQILKRYEKLTLEIVDGVEAVSNNALVHIKKVYGSSNDYQSIIVHCGIEIPIKYEKWKEYREMWRIKYNLKRDDLAYVYAGGIAKWQNIDEIIEQAKSNTKIKLYIYTSPKNQDILKNKYQLSNNIYFDFLSHEELQKALCAFDYGCLLRNKDITNYVAFPNKYSDYINARLSVVVKNNDIGYYPIESDRQEIIINVKDISYEKKELEYKLYDDYIDDLSYTKMVENLIKYYEEL